VTSEHECESHAVVTCMFTLPFPALLDVLVDKMTTVLVLFIKVKSVSMSVKKKIYLPEKWT
jgi:hypothetical protein